MCPSSFRISRAAEWLEGITKGFDKKAQKTARLQARADPRHNLVSSRYAHIRFAVE